MSAITEGSAESSTEEDRNAPRGRKNKKKITNEIKQEKEEDEEEVESADQQGEPPVSDQVSRRFCFLCLFGFNVAFKHLRSYLEGACL